MIKMQVIGNLGKDCTVNTVNGKNVMNFNVAHTERFKDAQGNQQERTTWVECSYWSDRTAVAQYLVKGKQVYVEGRPEVRTYPKNDGTTGASLTLYVREVQLLGGRGDAVPGSGPSNYNNANAGQGNAPVASEMNEPIDDLPF
jgi:single-strand DNA-binding protein